MGGGLIGTASNIRLGENERRSAIGAEYRALEYTPGGTPVPWASGGVSGEVIAYQPYRVGSQDCRQYAHAVDGGAGIQTLRGTACRNEDGSWSPLT